MTAETFFQELKRLIKTEIKPPVHAVNCEDCEYADHVYQSKHLFKCFDCLKCSTDLYVCDSLSTVNSMDCDYNGESELCYESVDAFKCFNSNYLENCAFVADSWYSTQCRNGKYLFGCVNLRNKSYCIFNRQVNPEQYEQLIQKYKTWPQEKVLAIVEDLKKRYPVTQTNEANNENTTYGNYMYYNKNCYLCFDSSNNSDSCYLYDTQTHKTCFDATYSSENELCYQIVDSGRCFNANYVIYSGNCQDGSYIINCFDVKNSLGAVSVDHAQYLLLNRQLTKEDYERESKIILDDIKVKNLQWHDIVYY